MAASDAGARVRTLGQARAFVLESRICTVFSRRRGIPCLWEVVDLPDKQPGESGWGEKISHVWRWKNELPEQYPDEIFYGKLPGGHAVLMALAYLEEVHYPAHHRPLSECSHPARRLFDLIRAEPYTTGVLRQEAIADVGCTRSAFEKALRELQVTLNIVRANDPGVGKDLWVPLSEQYPRFRG